MALSIKAFYLNMMTPSVTQLFLWKKKKKKKDLLMLCIFTQTYFLINLLSLVEFQYITTALLITKHTHIIMYIAPANLYKNLPPFKVLLGKIDFCCSEFSSTTTSNPQEDICGF